MGIQSLLYPNANTINEVYKLRLNYNVPEKLLIKNPTY